MAANSQTVVLIVEDDPMIQLAASEFIKTLGFAAYVASDADEAISILQVHSEITIVFTDVQMAGSMDGLALSRWAAKRWPPLRFIVVSGGMVPRIEDMPAGAIFIPKPYGDVAISNAIEGFR